MGSPARKAALKTAADVPEDANRHELMATMGMDALRLARCQPTRTYAPEAVIAWLQCTARAIREPGHE